MLKSLLRPIKRPSTAAITVFFAVSVIASTLIWWGEQIRSDAERVRVQARASSHAAALQKNLESALMPAYALGAWIAAGNGEIAAFDAFGAGLLQLYPNASALAVAPDGVVSNIVPFAENKGAIGHDMLRDPARAKEAVRARDSGQLTLAGPFKLKQGGVGAVARLPVYLSKAQQPRRFWGFTTVLLRFPDVLLSTSLSNMHAEGLEYVLWREASGQGREVIATSLAAGTTMHRPVDHAVKVADATWTLSVTPTDGWGDRTHIGYSIGLGLGFAAMLALLAKLMLERRIHKLGLQELVTKCAGEIQQFRRKFQTTIDSLPDAMWEVGLDGAIHAWHSGPVELLQQAAQTAVGKNIKDIFSSGAAGVIMAAVHEAHKNGRSVGKQISHTGSAGKAWFELSVSQKRGAGSEQHRFVVLAHDISERMSTAAEIQRLTRVYAALTHSNQAIIRCTSEEDLFPLICRYAVEFGGMKMAWIGMTDAASQRVLPVASFGDASGYLQDIEISIREDSPFGRGPTGTAVRTNQPVWCQDYWNEPLTAPWRERGMASGWGGVGALPLTRNGEVVGVFALCAHEANAFDETAQELLTEMASDISFAMDNFAREASGKQAEEELRQNTARYKAVTQYAIDAIITTDSRGNIVGWNDRATALFGYTEAEASTQSMRSLIPAQYHFTHRAGLCPAFAEVPLRVGGTPTELVGRHKDGTEFPIELSVANWEVSDERFITVFIRDITQRKRADAHLRLAAKVFEQSAEGIMITDAQHNIVLINQAFSAITGYSEAEAIGNNPRMLSSGRHDASFYMRMRESVNTAGHWEGEIWNRRKDGREYPEWLSISRVLDTEGQVANYIGIFSDITLHKAAEERIVQLAHFDPLTGLANRTLLRERLAQSMDAARRNKSQMAVLLFDLDHFKHINDSLGHTVGDALLTEVAARVSGILRSQDTLARLGGDEFILVLPDTDVCGAERVADKLLQAIGRPFTLDKHEFAVTPSIGIAMYPRDGTDHDALYKCADVAMYRAKEDGRNLYRFYTGEMQIQIARSLQLENALRNALKQGELFLEYQPQVAIGTGMITGAEALLRWRHPELGMISPAEFVPIAERTGQILPIGEWVLRTAARQCKAWLDKGLHLESIAVNLSAVQFRHAGLIELVSQILDDEKLPPQRLELELTESEAMDSRVCARTIMDKLHELGARMAIDDFGTGYSSLSYLKRFKVGKLKIDRSFVSDITEDPEDRTIVRTIIDMARSLGMGTVAEGVETKEQLAFLRENGCDEAQGYYFSKPLSPGDLERFMRAQRDLIPVAPCGDMAEIQV